MTRANASDQHMIIFDITNKHNIVQVYIRK